MFRERVHFLELGDLVASREFEYASRKGVSILQIRTDIAASDGGCEELPGSSHGSFSVGVEQYIITVNSRDVHVHSTYCVP